MSMGNVTTDYTGKAENTKGKLEETFRYFPMEEVQERLQELLSKKESSSFFHEMEILLKGCGLDDCNDKKKNIKMIQALLKEGKIKTKEQLARTQMEKLYSLYNEYLPPQKYMERIVNELKDKELERDDDTVRVAILKQLTAKLKGNGAVFEAAPESIKDLIANLSKGKGGGVSADEVIAEIKDDIFEALEPNATRKMNEKIRELLKTANDLASGVFNMNGRTRKDLYMFAFAFGMRVYEDKTDFRYDKLKDVEKMFFDVYGDTPFRHILDAGDTSTSAIPAGEGINYKNFAEIVCMYYLNKEEQGMSEYDKFTAAMKCIEKCKRLAAEKSFEEVDYSGGTLLFKVNYWTEVLNVEEEDLPEYICKNYDVPKPCDIDKSNLIEMNKEDTIAILRAAGVPLNLGAGAEISIIKQFLRHGYTGDAKVTGVTTFRTKMKKLMGADKKADITDDVNEIWLSRYREVYKDEGDTKLPRMVKNLVSGEFVKWSSGRENLLKFAFVFGMKLYTDTACPDYNELLDVDKLMIKYFGEGIDYTDRTEVICAYYLAKDNEPVSKRMKKAFTAIAAKPVRETAEAEAIEDAKAYFMEKVLQMDENELAEYVSVNCNKKKDNSQKSDFDVRSEKITALRNYDRLISEIYDTSEEVESEDGVRAYLLDSMDYIREEFEHDKIYGADKDFLKVLDALEHMVKTEKTVNERNVSRTDLIILGYYKMYLDLGEEYETLSELYSETLDYIDNDLIEARFSPLSASNLFDVYVVSLLYRNVFLAPRKL